MAIKRATIDTIKLYRGAIALTKVYKGSTLIWEPPTPSVTVNNTFNTTMSFNILSPTETKYASTMMLYLY